MSPAQVEMMRKLRQALHLLGPRELRELRRACDEELALRPKRGGKGEARANNG